jgi:hypothetical protein
VDLEFLAGEPVVLPGGTFTLFAEAEIRAMGEVEVPERWWSAPWTSTTP